MKEKPILFSTPMVQQILDDRKTQTRRVIKTPGKNVIGAQILELGFSFGGKTVGEIGNKDYPFGFMSPVGISYPRYLPGDILWVRESFCRVLNERDMKVYIFYKADEEKYDPSDMEGIKWKPSIHMPRAAARIFLRVVDVRAEQLQDISIEDSIAEGFDIEFLKKWVKDNYSEPDENQHWIYDKLNGDADQSRSYCHKCGQKEVSRARKEARKKGASKDSVIENIWLDGGWGIQESDNPSHCETCGKRLTTSLVCYDGELDHFREYGFTKNDTYVLDQLLNENIDVPDLPRIFFHSYWNILNAKRGYGLEVNPEVWVYEFERVEKPQ